MKKFKFNVSNRLDFPFDLVQMQLIIRAETRSDAMKIAAEFGLKHKLLLTADF